MVSERIPVIVVTGPVGAGKSATVQALSTLLGQIPMRHVAIDMDSLRRVVPEPEDDRFGEQLGLRNLAAIWPNLLDVGIQCAVLADVVESPELQAIMEREGVGDIVINAGSRDPLAIAQHILVRTGLFNHR